MADVYIAFAEPDEAWTAKLVDVLEARGLRVAKARERRDEIAPASNAEPMIVVVWSVSSIGDAPVMEAARIGRARGCLLPIRRDAVALPPGFRSIHTLDLSNWSGAPNDRGVQQLIQECLALAQSGRRRPADGTADRVKTPGIVPRVLFTLTGSFISMLGAPIRSWRGSRRLRQIAGWAGAGVLLLAAAGAGLAEAALLDEDGARRAQARPFEIAAVYDHDGARLVALDGPDGVARVYRDGVRIATIRGHDAPIERAAFADGGDLILTSDASGMTEATSLYSLAASDSPDVGPGVEFFHDVIWYPYGRDLAARWLGVIRRASMWASHLRTGAPTPHLHVAPASPARTASVAPVVPKIAARFIWPLSGHIIDDYGADVHGDRNDGINIAVPDGTPIRAAASGQVSYAGNELRGYGNLVLIRHDDGYITAYAHAKSIVVARGDYVQKGQIIAYAGQSGDVTSPQLHFEIRKDTKTINPRSAIATPISN